jgi:transcriptional regulator with XRE-family HTH domain
MRLSKALHAIATFFKPSKSKQVAEVAKRIDELASRLDECASRLSELERSEGLSKRVLKLENLIDELKGQVKEAMDKIESISKAMQLVQSFGEEKRNSCKYYREDGYCGYWRWFTWIEGFNMKEERDPVLHFKFYRLYVKEHAIFCAICQYFTLKY